jgi:predicted small secreted protein
MRRPTVLALAVAVALLLAACGRTVAGHAEAGMTIDVLVGGTS